MRIAAGSVVGCSVGNVIAESTFFSIQFGSGVLQDLGSKIARSFFVVRRTRSLEPNASPPYGFATRSISRVLLVVTQQAAEPVLSRLHSAVRLVCTFCAVDAHHAT